MSKEQQNKQRYITGIESFIADVDCDSRCKIVYTPDGRLLMYETPTSEQCGVGKMFSLFFYKHVQKHDGVLISTTRQPVSDYFTHEKLTKPYASECGHMIINKKTLQDKLIEPTKCDECKKMCSWWFLHMDLYRYIKENPEETTVDFDKRGNVIHKQPQTKQEEKKKEKEKTEEDTIKEPKNKKRKVEVVDCEGENEK